MNALMTKCKEINKQIKMKETLIYFVSDWLIKGNNFPRNLFYDVFLIVLTVIPSTRKNAGPISRNAPSPNIKDLFQHKSGFIFEYHLLRVSKYDEPNKESAQIVSTGNWRRIFLTRLWLICLFFIWSVCSFCFLNTDDDWLSMLVICLQKYIVVKWVMKIIVWNAGAQIGICSVEWSLSLAMFYARQSAKCHLISRFILQLTAIHVNGRESPGYKQWQP